MHKDQIFMKSKDGRKQRQAMLVVVVAYKNKNKFKNSGHTIFV